MARDEEHKEQGASRGSPRRGGLASGTETGSGAGAIASGNQSDWANAGVERGGGEGEWETPEDVGGDRPASTASVKSEEDDIGSKRGFALSDERDHETGGSNYERTGTDLYDGMGGSTDPGPHSSNRS